MQKCKAITGTLSKQKPMMEEPSLSFALIERQVDDDEFMRNLILLLIATVPLLAGAQATYKSAGQIPIGGEGGWDILTIDSAAQRLYLSHATKVVVVDLNENKVAGEIADTPGVHAFLSVPELQRGFSTNGKENKISAINLKTLTTDSKIDVGESPDAMCYDSKRGELYVFNHRGNSANVIDPKSSRVVATIPLGGTPEFGVA